MNATSIYLSHKNKILVPEGTGGKLNVQEVATLLANLETMGFRLSEELILKLITFNTEQIAVAYSSLISAIKNSIGAHVKYEPMYPNFPKQVMEASEAELYLNAIMHYSGDLFGLRIMPSYSKEERAALTEKTDITEIGLGNETEFLNIFTNLLSSKSSISEENKKEIEWFVKSAGENIFHELPEEIPLKENVALIARLLFEHTKNYLPVLKKYVKTATDVLRIAVSMSGGDISLAEQTKFRAFSRMERNFLKALTEQCSDILEDIYRYKEEWKRLNEKLHVLEHNKKYPLMRAAMKTIHVGGYVETFNSKLEAAIISRNSVTILELLKERPGEFARRLDHVLRTVDAQVDIVRAFDDVASSVSSTVLIQVMAHFKYRNEPRDLRVFFPKGNVSKMKAIDNTLPDLAVEICEQIVFSCKKGLRTQFRKLDNLGKVYIDQRLKNFAVPFSQRSASRSLKTISRGSRLSLPDKNIIRMFLWWKNGKYRTDLDLSASILDDKFQHLDQVSYTHLRTNGVTHSGDITSAPRGASEFIDLDIGKLLSRNARYIVMSVYSYTDQPYCDLPECFAGFMSREEAQSGQIYEPKTVNNKFDLTSNTRVSVPLIFDLVDREVVWTDLSLTTRPNYHNALHENMSSLEILSRAMIGLKKTNLYELFSLHAEARGTLVADRDDADIIFGLNGDVIPTDIEEILANYL